MSVKDEGYKIALEEGRQGVKEGGVGVGSAIISTDGKLLGRGRNMRLQNGSHILHIEAEADVKPAQAETAAFDQDRSLKMADFKGATLYTTMSCCPMCTGAAIWFKVGKVVIGDSTNFTGPEHLMREAGIEVVVLNDKDAISLCDNEVVKKLD